MAEILNNLKIENVIGLLKKPDVSIAFGNVSRGNSSDITTIERLEKFLEEAYDHDIEITLVDNSKTENILKLLTNKDYIDELDECFENAFIVVYHLGEKDLIVWLETSGFMIGCDIISEHSELESFISVPHFYPTKELLNDVDSTFYHYMDNNPDILEALREISIDK